MRYTNCNTTTTTARTTRLLRTRVIGEPLRRRVVVAAEGAVLGVLDCAARASVSRRRVAHEFEREHVQNFWQPIIASCNAMIRSSWRPYSLPVYVLRTAHAGCSRRSVRSY